MSPYAGYYEPTAVTLPISPTPARGAKFFRETGITTGASFAETDLKGPKYHVDIENTGAQSLEYSFDGTTTHGTLASSATIEFNKMFVDSIWLKNGTGATTATVRAWTGEA